MLTNPQQLYEAWLNDPDVDELTKEELRSIKDESGEIEDRFIEISNSEPAACAALWARGRTG
jgi:hypothetical protein